MGVEWFFCPIPAIALVVWFVLWNRHLDRWEREKALAHRRRQVERSREIEERWPGELTRQVREHAEQQLDALCR